MLLVGSAKAKLLAIKLDGIELKKAKFKVVNQVGLNITVEHDAEDDVTAKKIIKEYVKSIPELNNLFLSVKIVDEKGNLL